MDTGSTLYEKLQRSLARKNKKKRKEAAAKGVKTRIVNQRIRNEEAGKGYHSDNELKSYQRRSEKKRKEFAKKRKAGYEAYLKRKHAEMRAREREKAKEKKAAMQLKEREKAKAKKKHEREAARNKARANEKNRKRLLKHPIWQKGLKPYRLYLAVNGHCTKTNLYGLYKTLDEAREMVKKLKTEEKNVYFECLSKTYPDGTKESKYEYVIFKDVRDDVAQPTYLKNEFGKYVEHNVDAKGKNYEIVEKYEAKVEDTVWVFGYDPRKDRKTFLWVFENVLQTGFEESFDMKRIYLYHNKVVLCNDRNEVDIIICKTARDAVRFYNKLQEMCKKGPYLFMGVVTTRSALCEPLEKLLLAKTGWDLYKLRRNQHRF